MTPDETSAYEAGYRDCESSREADIVIAVAYSRTLEELLEKLRALTGEDLELGSEWGESDDSS